MPIIVELAYNMAKSYIKDGWKIAELEIRDFVFHEDIGTAWND
jgi:hypothetical protein